MSMRSSASASALTNAVSSYSPFAGAGMDGSNLQVAQAQQGNRTTTQGDQSLSSSGGTGGVSGGGAGPGSGPAGSSGFSHGTSGGSNGSAGGPPQGGQETGHYTTHNNKTSRETKDTVTSEVVVTHHSGTSYFTSDMVSKALFSGWLTSTKDESSKLGTKCPICPKKK